MPFVTGDVIKPSENMTLEERATQMWRVHPNDLDRLGYAYDENKTPAGPRERFYLDHLKAAQRSSPYVEAFRREETRADKAEERLDEALAEIARLKDELAGVV